MTAFVAQVKKWLKKDGIFYVGYQEGDVIPKTLDAHTTMLTKALKENNMTYEVTDITKQTYKLLKIKRESAIKHQAKFEEEGNSQWFDSLRTPALTRMQEGRSRNGSCLNYGYGPGRCSHRTGR